MCSDFIDEWVKIGLPAKEKVKANWPNSSFSDQCEQCEKVGLSSSCFIYKWGRIQLCTKKLHKIILQIYVHYFIRLDQFHQKQKAKDQRSADFNYVELKLIMIFPNPCMLIQLHMYKCRRQWGCPWQTYWLIHMSERRLQTMQSNWWVDTMILLMEHLRLCRSRLTFYLPSQPSEWSPSF